jgi:hypothetical protein
MANNSARPGNSNFISILLWPEPKQSAVAQTTINLDNAGNAQKATLKLAVRFSEDINYHAWFNKQFGSERLFLRNLKV